MLCVIAVFIPSFFMVGVGRALFRRWPSLSRSR